MRLEEVLPALREGKKIRRQSCGITTWNDLYDMAKFLSLSDLEAEDWEVSKEPATIEEIEIYFRNQAKHMRDECENESAGTYEECADILRDRKIPK